MAMDNLGEIIDQKDSILCVGLDPVPERIPDGYDVTSFCEAVIEATAEHAAAFKPNTAYFEALDKWDSLIEVTSAASRNAFVVLDAKRGDIGFSSERYAELQRHCDAMTVNPYMGHDSVAPFIEKKDKGAFVLTKTSNDGSSDFQDLLSGGEPIYRHVARRCSEWNDEGNIGLVVGATHVEELREIREVTPSLPFLVPGVGAQGGAVEAAVRYGVNDEGIGLVNSTRGIIYAGDSGDFLGGVERAAVDLKKELNKHR